MNKLSRFFGRLFATEAYMATLSDDEILIRSCTSKREVYKRMVALRELERNQARLDAILDRLGVKVYSPPTMIFYGPGEDPNRQPSTYTKGTPQ